MMRPVTLALLAGVAVATRPATAAAQGFTGAVVEERLRVPLVGLPVRLLQLRQADSVVVDSALTDERGLFQLFGGEAGVYRLRFGHLRGLAQGPADTVGIDSVSAREYVVPILRSAEERAFVEVEVSRSVVPLPNAGLVRYPEELREANIEGRVVAQFVVDTTGRVMRSTFTALYETHPEFTRAVRDATFRMRFRPAEYAGIKVPQLVQQPFDFSLTRDPPGTDPRQPAAPRRRRGYP